MEESVQRVGSSLEKKLEDADLRRRRLPTDCIAIFRVPDRIRKYDAEAYEPKLISIGPYHRGKPRLQPMDEFKLRCTRMILRRNSNTGLERYVAEIKSVELERYVEEIKSVELEARSFYSEDTNNIATDEFVMMMLLDGCFIVQLLLMLYGNEKNEEKNEMLVHMNRLGISELKDDMIMLENQIPFFVIQKIFDLALAGGSREASLVDLALRFLRGLIPCDVVAVEWSEVPHNQQVHHLLHLFHTRLIPARRPESGISAVDSNAALQVQTNKIKMTVLAALRWPWLRWGWCPVSTASGVLPLRTATDLGKPLLPEKVPSATKLDQAGVKFRSKNNVECFLDISFNGRTLEIPQLPLYDNTVLILRNLAAFEQCYLKNVGSYVTAYSAFMDLIIDTAEDVALLHRKGVIVNSLGNNEDGAVLFNKLCKGVTLVYCDTSSVWMVK